MVYFTIVLEHFDLKFKLLQKTSLAYLSDPPENKCCTKLCGKRAWWVFGKTKGILNGNDVDILFKKKIQEQISNLYRGMSKSFTNQILNAF